MIILWGGGFLFIDFILLKKAAGKQCLTRVTVQIFGIPILSIIRPIKSS